MRAFSALLLSFPALFLISGCALTPTAASGPLPGAAFNGTVHGGQQAIVQAHVHLMAAAANGYGKPSISLLNSALTGVPDTIGAYVLTDGSGEFTITGDYVCVPATQVYIYVTGGDPGSGENSAVGLMTALGSCPVAGTFAITNPNVEVNELTTIAAAYALSGFATDALHISSSGTAPALIGISNAFLNAGNLVENVNGTALATTPAGNGTVPQQEINLIGNILSSCINSGGPSSSACTTLFTNTLANGTTGAQPTDVAGAAINLAHNPSTNIGALYGIPVASPPFGPALPYQPVDFTIALKFTGGGVSENDSFGKTIAVAGDGSVWQATGGGLAAKLSSLGVPISPSTGFGAGIGGGENYMMVDETGNGYALVGGINYGFYKWGPSGAILAPANGFLTGDTHSAGSNAIAFDPAGNIWATNFFQQAYGGGVSLAKFNQSGTLLSEGTVQSELSNPSVLAVDSSSHIWLGDGTAVFEFSLAGTPISSAGGDAQGDVNHPYEIAFDTTGDLWLADSGSNQTELSSTGGLISPAGGYTGNGFLPGYDLAIDGAGHVFVPNSNSSQAGLVETDTTGTIISFTTGYEGGYPGYLIQPSSVALDGSGDAWCTNLYGGFGVPATVLEYIGVSTPVVVPLALAIRTGTLGQRP